MDNAVMNDENRKVILVTGCSSGIGREAAERLARKGHFVYATARRNESLDELSARARAVGDQMRVEQLDVQDWCSIQRAVGRAYEERGRIDAVVNNAGFGQFGAVEEVTDEEAWRQFDVNLVGVLRVARAVLPLMRPRRSGRIINVSSIAAHVAMPFMGMYCASKHALEAMSTALRLEVAAWNILVIVVEPGPVPTPFQDKVFVSGQASEDREASPYAEVIARAEKVRRRLNARGSSPIWRVTDCIEHAATARRPRVRYRDSALARWAPRLFSLLPDRVLDCVLRRHFGL